MHQLREALDSAKPAIEAGLEAAERERDELEDRRRDLEALISRAKSLLEDEAEAMPFDQRPTLHGALERILREKGNDWMTVPELTAAVNQRSLYRKRDGSPVEANQVHARTRSYSRLFEKRDGKVRLREPRD